MGTWKLGASAKEFKRLEEYYQNFDFLEIDLEKASDSIDSMEEIMRRVNLFSDKVHSIHLRYEPTDSKGGFRVILSDMRLSKEFGDKIYVVHTVYPTTPEILERQVRVIGDEAARLGIKVAVENLCDRGNKCGGYNAPRNPVEIVELLEKIGNPSLGLCLDTGHALSNVQRTAGESLNWDNLLMRKWLMHVHYNDNTIGGDEHLPISDSTSHELTEGLKNLTQDSAHDGVLILEHRKFEEAIESRDYLARDKR